MEFTKDSLLRSYQSTMTWEKDLIPADIARKSIDGKHLLFNKALKYPAIQVLPKVVCWRPFAAFKLQAEHKS